MGGQDIDYEAVKVPEGKHPEEYHYTERRAEILHKIRNGASPWSLNQTELAKRYDVSQPQIHKDLKRLKSFLRDNLGADAALETNELFREIITQMREDAAALRANGERSEAARTEKGAASVLNKWYEWLFEGGVKERAPRRTEVDANVDVNKRETKVYAGVDLADLPGVDEARLKGVNDPADGEHEAEDGEAAEIEVE